MKLKIKKLHPDAVIPHYATVGSAGFDLTAIRSEYSDNSSKRFFFGLAFEIPKGYVGMIFPRSSIVNTCHRLANCVGIIDSDYRGEVSATFDYVAMGKPYSVGERIAQMVIVPIQQVKFELVDQLDQTERGTGGHGSTGV